MIFYQVHPMLANGDKYHMRSGLELLFTPDDAKARAPTRWKQFLVTWSVIYPLVLGVPNIITPLIQRAHLPENHYLKTLLSTGTIVLLMVYFIMPRYTKRVHHWLFRQRSRDGVSRL